MNFTIMPTGIYHQICKEISKEVNFPVPYVGYCLYEILLKESFLNAFEFFVESELARFLTNMEDKYTLSQNEEGEIILVKEKNGIFPSSEAISWDELFRLHNIECPPALQRKIDSLLLRSLRSDNTMFSEN